MDLTSKIVLHVQRTFSPVPDYVSLGVKFVTEARSVQMEKMSVSAVHQNVL